ncbi:hypothetical protein FRX31_029336 [Thalictrum thalictroides]|uniref:DUF4283 domain-containing protein n=1 Tax=Thalictrum thalictroides TaxID=46969 RepID=A0A7J6V8G9_THATH|nr:hypothetical protein FRX31_029336 [Thalictrum thalictroides]
MARSRVSLTVEGKDFVFEHWRNAKPEEEVGITEKTRGKVFTGVLSLGGARWICKLLCQISGLSTLNGNTFTFDDRFFKIKAVTRSNRRGFFLQTLIVPKIYGRKAACLCFPAGENQKNWLLIGESFKDLLPQNKSAVQTQANPSGNDARVRENFSFADVCAAKPSLETNNRVSFRRGLTVMDAQWWQPVVLCSYVGKKPDWFWVRDKVRTVCGNLSMKITAEGEAIILFDDERCREKLLSIPPLQTWEGCFTFRSWGPRDGAFPMDLLQCDVMVKFSGIPFHLRTRRVVEALAMRCGTSFTIVDNSIDFCKGYAVVLIKKCDWCKLPRSITIEERGYLALVLVEATRCTTREEEELVGELSELRPTERVGEPPIEIGLPPITCGHVEPAASLTSMSHPPGFTAFEPARQDDFFCRPIVRNTNPFIEDHVETTLASKADQNSFEPLILLENNDDSGQSAHNDHHDGSDPFYDSEPIRPLAHTPKRYGKKPKQHKKVGAKGPLWGKQKWLWIASNKNSLHRRQQNRGPTVTTRATDEVIADLSPQRSPCTLAPSNPGPSSSFSPPVLSSPRNPNPFMVPFSSPPVSVVPNSQSSLGEGVPSSRMMTTHHNREEVLSSLIMCTTEEDFKQWLRWMVVPLAGELGMTTSMGLEGQIKLFTELGLQETVNQKAFEAPLQLPSGDFAIRDQFVSDVV